MKLGWRPMICAGCGQAIDEWAWPIEPGVYVACVDCGIPYLVTDTGLTRVAWSELAPELAQVIEEVMRTYWSERIAVAAAYRRAA